MNAELMKLSMAGYLSGSIVSGATVLCITSGNFPTDQSGTFRILIDKEIKRLRGAAGPVYTIVEAAAEGTLESPHYDLCPIMHVQTPQSIKNTTGGVNAQTGTSYSIAAVDARALVTFSNVSAIAVTLPQATTGDTSNFGPNFWVMLQNLGAGTVTVTPTTSTINGASSLVLLTNQGAVIFSDGTNYFTSNPVPGTGVTVYSGNIASGNIGWPHHASGSVRSGHIANTAITSGNYSSGSIFGYFLSSGTVLSGHVGDNAVNSGNVGSGQLSWVHLASGAVRSGNIANTAVTSGNIASGAIGPFHLSSPSVLSGHVGSGAVTGQAGGGFFAIASGTITTNDIGSGAIVSGLIASGQIGSKHIGSGLLTGFELGSGAIVSGRIASGQVGFGHLADGSVHSGTIQSGRVFSLHLQSGTIFAGDGVSVTIYESGITVANTSGGGGSTAANPPGYIYGLNTVYVTSGSNTIQITSGTCRDKGNSVNITLAGTQTIDHTTSGALGCDTSNISGNVFTVSGTVIVSGNGTTFRIEFGQRTVSGTMYISGTNVICFSGTNNFVGSVYQNDLLGTTSGFYRIATVNSGLCTLTKSGASLSGSAITLIENPTLTCSGFVSGTLFSIIDVIVSDTTLIMASNAAFTRSGLAVKGGPSPGVFMFPWIGTGASGTTVYLSTQRTTPYGV